MTTQTNDALRALNKIEAGMARLRDQLLGAGVADCKDVSDRFNAMADRMAQEIEAILPTLRAALATAPVEAKGRRPMTNIFQLDPHTNMTVEECLEYCRREKDVYQDVMVLSYDEDGELVIRSSHMSRKDAAWMLMEAMDHVRGIDDQ